MSDTPKHHLDKRASLLIAIGHASGQPDDLFSTKQLATWLGTSKQWIEIGRHKGYGPPFLRIGRMVRYRRDVVLKWLDTRQHQCTADYSS